MARWPGPVDDAGRHPDVAQEDGGRADLAAVDPLLLEDQALEAVDELVVVVEQDGGVEDADHAPVSEKMGEAAFMTRAWSSVWRCRAAGQRRAARP